MERKRGVQKSRGGQKDEEGGNKRKMERARERGMEIRRDSV